MSVTASGVPSSHFDRAPLTAWLNVGNGAIGYNLLADSNDDGTPDTPFVVIVSIAEAVRINPASTRALIEAQKNTLERINGDTP